MFDSLKTSAEAPVAIPVVIRPGNTVVAAGSTSLALSVLKQAMVAKAEEVRFATANEPNDNAASGGFVDVGTLDKAFIRKAEEVRFATANEPNDNAAREVLSSVPDVGWCAAVGMPQLSLLSAVHHGIDLAYFPQVPRPGKKWAIVTAALLAEFDVVLVCPPVSVRHDEARRLSARARERGAVLIPVLEDATKWPLADLRLQCRGMEWGGLARGHGRLRGQRLRVCMSGKGVASRPIEQWVSLAS